MFIVKYSLFCYDKQTVKRSDKMTEYQKYQTLLGPIPKFLEKYLTLDILVRLQDISLICGMDYASPHAYDISFFISRFSHSLNVALITWRLTHDKRATLSALFHDVASPVFAHVIDYMNGDSLYQESTEEKTKDILYNHKELRRLLDEDNIDIEDIIDFKKYSIVDLERPKMCADRLDNTIGVGMQLVHKINLSDATLIINSISKTINEDGEEEICFNSLEAAQKMREANDAFNALTHSRMDNYMMNLLAEVVKKCLMLSLVTYDDLFTLTEHEMLDIIEQNQDIDRSLQELWFEFKTISHFNEVENNENVKNKIINPLVISKRLNNYKQDFRYLYR